MLLQMGILIYLAEKGRFVCKVCNDASQRYKIEGRIPKNLEMYIKPPVSMLEDAVSVMMVLRSTHIPH